MKERIKSFILILLIIAGIGLTSITWIDERLWPEGYSLFVNVKNWPIVRNIFGEDYSLPLENLGKARKIVVADGFGSSAVFYDTDKTYAKVYGDINGFMVDFLKGNIEINAQTTATKEDVRELMNERMTFAYVNYPVATNPTLFGSLMGVAQVEELSSLSAVRDFIIIPTFDGRIELIALEYGTDKVMAFEVKDKRSVSFIENFTKYMQNVDPAHNCMFALEMNMDIETEDAAVKTKTVLDSFLVLDSASTADINMTDIESKNPLSEEKKEKLVEAFSFNPSSPHRYVDIEGTTKYIKNESSLKIYQNGIVEFEAIDESGGIALDNGYSDYESLNAAIKFAGSLYFDITGGTEFPVHVGNEAIIGTGNERTFYFDYYAMGVPVTTDILLGGEKMNHAIEITVRDNKIIKLRMLFREYLETTNEKPVMNIYGAIDKIAADYAKDETVYLKDVFLSYKEDGVGGVLSSSWVAETDRARIIISN